MSEKILLLEKLHAEAVALLSEVGDIIQAERLEEDYLRSLIVDASAVMTRGAGRVQRELLLAGKNLRCVARCGVGTDNIDVATATELGLPVFYAPGSTTTAVAEHALMLMLMVARRAAMLNREVKKGNWAIRSQIEVGRELGGKTLGIIGLGDIGRRTGELGRSFGMKVIYWSRQSQDDRFIRLERNEVIQSADFISINVALNDETRGFIDGAAFALMKPSAILINTARGEVVDEQALYDALREQRLGGAGLDVIATDSPHEKNTLWELENVVVTPHVAAVTDVAFRRMCLDTATQVARVLRGELIDPHYVRNQEVLAKLKNIEHV